MKVIYESPEVEQDSRGLAEQVFNDLEATLGSRGQEIVARWGSSPTASGLTQYVLTLVDPKVSVQTFFLPADFQQPQQVNYRLLKSIAELYRLRAFPELN